jgi:DNA topoisomerase VI subunit B
VEKLFKIGSKPPRGTVNFTTFFSVPLQCISLKTVFWRRLKIKMGQGEEKAKRIGGDIVSRRPDEDYFQVSGLQRLTGSSQKDFDRVILRELIDNALDACEAAGADPEIHVGVERRGEATVLSVRDNGPGLSLGDVGKITDFDRLASSHHYLKEPSRGMIGFAWKIILGAASTLREVKGFEPKASVKVVSRGFRYELSPHWSHDTGPVVDMSCNPDESVPEGSTVAVELDHVPWFSSKNLYLELVEGYALLNPCASFSYTDEGGERVFPAVARRSGKGFRENIHCFTPQEFEHRVEAQIRERPTQSLKQFLSGFQFIGKQRIETRAKTVKDLHNDAAEIRGIYEQLKEKTKPPRHEHLPILREKAMTTRLSQVKGILAGSVPGYYRGGGEPRDPSSGIVIPYSVEVSAAVTESGNQRLYFGLNGSIKLEEPFRNYLLGKYRGRDIVGLTGLLESKGVTEEDSVVTVINMVCPNVPYKDPGKTTMLVDPFIDEVKKTVTKAANYIKKAKKGLGLPTSRVNISQKAETLRVLPEAINNVSSGGEYRYKQRQLWYVVRDMLGEMHPKYEYFTKDLIPAAKAEGIDLSGMLKEANSELHEPRSSDKVMLSTQEEENYVIPRYSFNKILYVEKRGYKDLIVANGFQDRYDLAVIGSQGESSEASRRLLARIQEASRSRGEKITILCVHDADLMGHDIYLTLRDGGEEEAIEVIDLGLSMIEATTVLGLKPEEATLEKPRLISEKLLNNLPLMELWLLTKKLPEELKKIQLSKTYRVELNSMNPEQFLSWLKTKLADLGILEKVHPPEEVVKTEVRTVTSDAVHKLVTDEILRFAGEDFVKFLELKLCEIVEHAYFDYDSLLDEALAKYPVEGWRDIVGVKAREKAEKHASSPWVKDEIRFHFMEILEEK